MGALGACAFWDMSDWDDRAGSSLEDASVDASEDAHRDGEGDAPSRCGGQRATDASFCDDFDRDTAVFEGWSSLGASVPGNVGFNDASRALSPPKSLRLTAKPQGSAFLRKAVAQPVRRLHYQAAHFIERSANASVYLCTQAWLFGDDASAVRITTTEGSTTLGQSLRKNGVETTTNKPLLKPVPYGRWVTIALDVTVGTNPTVTVRLDGEVVLDASALDPSFVPAPVDSYTGAIYARRTDEPPDQEWLIHVDDVVLAWE